MALNQKVLFVTTEKMLLGIGQLSVSTNSPLLSKNVSVMRTLLSPKCQKDIYK